MSPAAERPRRRRRHPLLHRLEFAALSGLLGLLGRIPAPLQRAFARGVGTLVYALLPIRRGVIQRNLARAFPEMSEAQRRRILRELHVHTILFALELAWLSRAPHDAIRRRVIVSPADWERYQALARGNGHLFFCAHQGNWEWTGAWYALTFGRCGVIYKPMHNPHADAWLRRLRERNALRTFSTREAVPRPLLRFLREGGCIGILADQDARHEGVFLPFFGEVASTSTGPASLALRLNLPLQPVASYRQPDGRLLLEMGELIRPDPTAPREAEERRIMSLYNAWVESTIRRAPEQYFWWHNRWKTRPPRD